MVSNPRNALVETIYVNHIFSETVSSQDAHILALEEESMELCL